MWQCPTCKSKDHLEVSVAMWTKLIQPDDEPEAFETDSDEASNHDHEWEENSVMRCMNCECADEGETHIAEYFDLDRDNYGSKERCDYDPPAPHDACENKGQIITAQALAELGPVGASIAAAEVEVRKRGLRLAVKAKLPDMEASGYIDLLWDIIDSLVEECATVRPADKEK